MDAIEALKTRSSVRAFKPAPVAREIVEEIVDCARLAPTAMNVQPWEFVAVTDAALRRRIADATGHAGFVAEAPVCVVVLSRETEYFLEDCCAATENILVAARAKGLGSCWVAGEKQAYTGTIRELVGAPEGLRVVSLVALGYPAEEPEREKRPLAEVLHFERF